MTEHKIDLNKVPIKVFYRLFTGENNTSDLIEFMNIAVEGGIMDLPITELPALMAEFYKEIQKNSDEIAIAIGSMKNFLDGKENI